MLAAFKARRLHVLVATDLAARGLPISRAASGSELRCRVPRPVAAHRSLPAARAKTGWQSKALFLPMLTRNVSVSSETPGIWVEREQIEGFEPTEVASPAAATGGVKRQAQRVRKTSSAKRTCADREPQPCRSTSRNEAFAFVWQGV
ncbi:MAG: hypothetical protein IPO35_19370 [Uliginosibacterium sp.]|nr:hypothetical protein [Uliginosibacterium sp.]